MQKELDDEKPQGEDALNSLFKQIYGSVSHLTDSHVQQIMT